MGDIHSEFKELVWTLTQRYKIEDANVVVTGDIGVGFNKLGYYTQLFKELTPKLSGKNITLYFIRGNHDNLEYWENKALESERFKFLQDHTIIELSGKTIYPIGGATSIDTDWRRDYNAEQEAYGSTRRAWWETEDIIKKPVKDLPGRVDIIASHTAPLCFEPVITRPGEITENIYNRDLENRQYLDQVFRGIRCKYWFYGHFHTSITSSLEDVVYRCLDINELYIFRDHE